MLAKRYRASGHIVARIFAKGKFYRGKTIGIKYVPARLPITRLAIIIPKKTLMKATKRNKLRRQVVELIKPLIEQRTPTPYDCTITIYKAEEAKTIADEIAQWLNK